MSGFVSILEPREEVPHLQALVDDIQGPEARGQGPGGAGPRLVGGRTKRVPEAEKEPGPVKAPETQRDSGVERDTGYPKAAPPPLPKPVRPAVPQRHVRRAVLAQDGHSSGEEMLYQALWNSKYTRQETRETKLVTIGWKAMSKMARMTPRNTKRNCQSLIDKLALEQLSDENSRESIGRTYRVFSYKSILERRRAAGMEWITRTRGVEFVSPPAEAPPEPVWTLRKAAEAEKRRVLPEKDPGVERDTGTERDTGVAAVVRSLREYLPSVDDASAADLVAACRQKTSDATADELAYFVRLKADLMFRMGTVKSPMGFLKTAVPRCFEGESFRQYRETEARRKEAAEREQAARDEEERRFQEEQQAILHDPKASEEERRIAREYLGIA